MHRLIPHETKLGVHVRTLGMFLELLGQPEKAITTRPYLRPGRLARRDPHDTTV